MFPQIWKNVRWHLAAILIILFGCCIYFYPQFEGKVLIQGDLVSSQAKEAEGDNYRTNENEVFLWSNGQFGGMPKLIGAPAKNNLLRPLKYVFRLGFDNPVGVFLSIGLLSYLLFVFFGVHPLGAAFLSLAVSLNTNNVILWGAGHASKVATLAYTPLIIAGIWLIFERYKYALGGAMFALGFALSIYTRHPQMTYYLFTALGMYGIVKLVQAGQNKEWLPLVKGVGVVLITMALGVGASASRVASMYQYNKSSMRGAPILEKEQSQSQSSSEVEGLAWEYAMQWSNGTVDLISSFVPAAAGGGSAYKVSRSNPFYKTYRVEQAPLYWGKLPFTEGPIYLGIVFFFLFVFGLFYLKGPMRWGMGLAVLWTLLLSMGKNVEWLNHFLFDHLPLYNKFRTPQSILSVTVFLLPVLGGLSLYKLVHARPKGKSSKKKKEAVKPLDQRALHALYWSVGIVGGFLLILWLLGPSLFTMEGAKDATYIQQGVDAQVLFDARAMVLRSDSLRSLFFVLATAVVLWLFIQRRLKSSLLFALALGILACIDVWGVSKRFLSQDDFFAPRKLEQQFAPRAVDEKILTIENKRHNYRVLDVAVNTFNSAYTSNFHNHVGGYHPAKLQRYQDVIDRYISNGNQNVLNMLNTKYVIQSKDNVQMNPGALGVAWTVEDLQLVDRPNDEINALQTINPAQTAVVRESEFGSYINGFDPTKDPNASISISSYKPDNITYSYTASSEQFVVFSEIWYGPDLGWQAYIDGEPADHIRVNYILRGMRVPAGQHEIVFSFRPKVYHTGETINLVSSGLIVILLLGALIMEYRKRQSENASPA